MARQIADANGTVILGRLDLPGLARNDVYRRASPLPGKTLEDAHIRWLVGSGTAAPERTRFVMFNAQLASAGLAQADPLRRLTSEAARLLKIQQRVGRLRPGLLADLVVWSGDPLDPTTKVLRVFVGGQQVYSAVD